MARGIVFAPTGEATGAIGAVDPDGAAVATGTVGPRGSGFTAPAVGTGLVGPSGSGALARGIVFAPTGDAGGAGAAAGGLGRREEPPGGAGGVGAGGAEGGVGAGGAEGGVGEVGAETLPTGAVWGASVGIGSVESIGSVLAPGGIGPVAGDPPMGAVEGASEGIGAVEPLGATGPVGSGARRLILTVSFFKGTVEVLTVGFCGSVSLGSLMERF